MRMLLRDKPRVESGEITVAFRRWRRPQVVAGRLYRTVVGRLEVTDVRVLSAEQVSEADAVAAGYEGVADLFAQLPGDESLPLHRIAFGLYGGPDERADLAASDDLDDDAVAAISARLDRLDRASATGAWTRQTLALIHAHPGRRAPDLAAMLGRERDPFKLDVRKLKNLGLTLSLPVGYELSPRGIAYVQAQSRRR